MPVILRIVLVAIALSAGGGAGMSESGQPRPVAVAFADLAGWNQADHRAALLAFRRSCREMMVQGKGFRRKALFGGEKPDWRDVCRLATRTQATNKAARSFFERHFTPVAMSADRRPAGLFTGYFEPEVEGSLEPDEIFRYPLHARPDDLVAFTLAEEKATGLRYGRRIKGKPLAYFTRKEIETGALDGRGLEIVWLKDIADRFFIQVQGSGRVRLRQGGVLRLAYAAKTGLPYTPVGRVLIDLGAIAREEMSMQAIRRWLKANPDKAEELLWSNESYVFFRKVELPDPRLGAPGAQGVQLAPLVSLAVDYRFWAYGSPVWLETRVPSADGEAKRPFRRLMVAQDTGSAIRGAVRGDIYFGFGDEAGRLAGRMQAPGRMAVLLPKSLARRLTSRP